MKKRTAPTNKYRPYFFILAVAAVVFAGVTLWMPHDPKATEGIQPGLPPQESAGNAPAFTLQDTQGGSVSLADFKGKVVVVDFWATWCPPCKREIPDFISLQSEYGSKGLQIIGVALDEPEKVRTFARQYGMNYPVLLGNDQVSSLYGGIEGIPTTFIIDRSGRIVSQIEGFAPRETFEEAIKKLL